MTDRMVAQFLEKELQNRGFKVIMTRSSDESLSTRERVSIANRVSKAILVSVGFRSGEPNETGVRTSAFAPVGIPAEGRPRNKSDLTAHAGNANDSASTALAVSIHGVAVNMTGRPDEGIRWARTELLHLHFH